MQPSVLNASGGEPDLETTPLVEGSEAPVTPNKMFSGGHYRTISHHKKQNSMGMI